MDKSIEDRAAFDLIRYASCWEDADILIEALQPAPGKRILSIASAGDNSMSLLANGASVVAADLSPAQLACVEIRKAAFAKLDYDQVLAFLGVRSCESRLAIYRSIASELSSDARAYWDRNEAVVEQGVIHGGKFEKYFGVFRNRVIPWIHSKNKIADLLREKTIEQQRTFYQRRWNTFRWRWMFRIFFSRFVMGRLGRDPEFFRYVEGSVSAKILARTEHALTEIPTPSNPYLTYILTGNFGEALPHYLRREHFDSIRNGLERLELFHGPIQEAAKTHGADGFDGYNLSDLFEYLNDDLCLAIYRQLLDVARPKARFAYWNMLVPRQVPEPLADAVQADRTKADELLSQDKAWFYSKFHIEEKLG